MAARHKGKHRARHHINPNKPSVFAKLPPLPTKEETATTVTTSATTTATPIAEMPVAAQIEDAATVGA